MKDSSREVCITVDGIPLTITIADDSFGGYEITSIVIDGSIYNIYDLIRGYYFDIIYNEVDKYLREEKLQQEMDIAEDKALWRDM